jgi:CRISPR-associated protein Cas5d
MARSFSEGPPLELKVWGDLACFTRPENKAERVSYPVMTPSAARGVLEAVLFKPEFRWRVREIAVLEGKGSRRGKAWPPTYFSILRNEVQNRVTEEGAQRGYYADEDRTQRHTLALRDVAYLIRADVDVRPGVAEDPAKYRDMFRRRVRNGQSFHTPYLGCREFAAAFGLPEPEDRPVPVDADLGIMLFDLDYVTDAQNRLLSAVPRFFHAWLEQGVLHVPDELHRPWEVGHAA